MLLSTVSLPCVATLTLLPCMHACRYLRSTKRCRHRTGHRLTSQGLFGRVLTSLWLERATSWTQTGKPSAATSLSSKVLTCRAANSAVNNWDMLWSTTTTESTTATERFCNSIWAATRLQSKAIPAAAVSVCVNSPSQLQCSFVSNCASCGHCRHGDCWLSVAALNQLQ